ncbi:MAG: glycosyltransferase, partial [Pelosinus sp.]|nr:glycosyltransferase [Pelosinus sp.]
IYNIYAKIDSRLRIIRFTTNHGVGYCRSAALQNARGKYIAVLDSDDIAAPCRLERQLAWFEKHSNTVLLASHFGIINTLGAIINEESLALSETEIRWRLIFGNCLGHSTVMLQKETALLCGGYNPTITAGEDMDLYSRIICFGSAAMLPEKLAFWRCHEQSLTAAKMQRLLPGYIQLVSNSIERHLQQKISPYTAYALFNNIYTPAPSDESFAEAVKITLSAYEIIKHSPFFTDTDGTILGRCVFTQLMDLQYRSRNESWWPDAVYLFGRALYYLCCQKKYRWQEDAKLAWPARWMSREAVGLLERMYI